MTRSRLIFLIRFTTLALVCWLLGMPLSVLAVVGPVALFMPVFGVNDCPTCCTATTSNAAASVSIGGITNRTCLTCNDFNHGVVCPTGCGGQSVLTGPFSCSGPFGISLSYLINCPGANTVVSASTFINPAIGNASGSGYSLGAKPADCSSFTASISGTTFTSNECDFSSVAFTVVV
jgi:hypothetical protein